MNILVNTAEYFFGTRQSPQLQLDYGFLYDYESFENTKMYRTHTIRKAIEDIRSSIQVKYPSKTKLCFGKNLKYCSSRGAI